MHANRAPGLLEGGTLGAEGAVAEGKGNVAGHGVGIFEGAPGVQRRNQAGTCEKINCLHSTVSGDGAQALLMDRGQQLERSPGRALHTAFPLTEQTGRNIQLPGKDRLADRLTFA